MRSLFTVAVLSVAVTAATGCMDEAGVVDENDRYTVPEPVPYAAPARSGQSTGVTGSPTGAGGVDMSGEARPGMWDAGRGAEVAQPAPSVSPYEQLPAGSVPMPQPGQSQPPDQPNPNAALPPQQQPRGASVQPQQPAANPASVPPTVDTGGNTAGTSTGR